MLRCPGCTYLADDDGIYTDQQRLEIHLKSTHLSVDHPAMETARHPEKWYAKGEKRVLIVAVLDDTIDPTIVLVYHLPTYTYYQRTPTAWVPLPVEGAAI